MSAAIIQQWLGMQCRNIPGVRSGLITMLGSDSAPKAVRWPVSQSPLPERLLKAAKTATDQRKAFVHIPKASNKETRGTVLALPLDIEGMSSSAAVLDCDELKPDQGRAALESLIEQLPKLSQLLNPPIKKTQSELPALELITRTLATGLTEQSFDASITAITTDLQARFKCERVSFGLWKNQAATVKNVSGTSDIAGQQKIFREIENVMNEAADQLALVCYPPNSTTKNRISRAHQDYVGNDRDSALATVPLIANEEVFGVLALERGRDEGFTEAEVSIIEHLACFLAPLLKIKKEVSAPWHQRVIRGRHKTSKSKLSLERKVLMLVAAVLSGIVITASLYSVPFVITTPAKIEGAIQRAVTAPTNGFIDEVFVRPGDSVKKGDLLATLDDNDLLLERRRLESEISQYQSDYSAAMATRNRSEMAIASAHMSESQAKLDLVNQQLKRLDLNAPFSGMVIDGDLSQALGSPVDKGQVLITLAPTDDFRLSLAIAESDIRHVENGYRGKLVLSSNPGEKISFEISRITPMASVFENNNVFEAEAALQNVEEISLRPGLEGYAKVTAGERSLLWVWGRELRDWLSMQTWKWTGSA